MESFTSQLRITLCTGVEVYNNHCVRMSKTTKTQFWTIPCSPGSDQSSLHGSVLVALISTKRMPVVIWNSSFSVKAEFTCVCLSGLSELNVNFCGRNSPCQQLCLLDGSGYSCACNTGLKINADSRTCPSCELRQHTSVSWLMFFFTRLNWTHKHTHWHARTHAFTHAWTHTPPSDMHSFNYVISIQLMFYSSSGSRQFEVAWRFSVQ